VINRRLLGLLTLSVFIVSGCGSDGLPKRYKVSGKVTYKGAPVAKGTVSFYPVKSSGENPGGFGNIVDGYYTLTTFKDGDGALPGEYEVSIDSREVDLKEAEKRAGGGAMRQDDVAKANAKAKLLIPRKYVETATSGLKATVKTSSNTFDFELQD